jgi:hypothetical protein
MGVFQQLCVILFIYFLTQKSKTTAAAEYAVAVLAVDMQTAVCSASLPFLLLLFALQC